MNKYRIPSARLACWDYSWPGSYFITICTKNREHFFGEIRNGEMYLNETGIIADQCWAAIPDHFKNVVLGEFVIMPNHTHGIINIERPVGNGGDGVETGHALSLHRQNDEYHYRFRNPGKNTISSMVGSFKSAVTRLARPVNEKFGWQTRFYDSIICSRIDYTRVANYILNNPANWDKDKLYK